MGTGTVTHAAAIASLAPPAEASPDDVQHMMELFERLSGPDDWDLEPGDATMLPSAPSAPHAQATRPLPPILANKVKRALTVPMYLLRTNGPSAFVVCSNSLDEKYRVHIGPQTCTCQRESCLHLLFVMVRVLQVSPTDPLLRATMLKDFELKMLLTRAEQRRASGQLRLLEPHENEAEVCPICLLDLSPDDVLSKCKSCNKRYEYLW